MNETIEEALAKNPSRFTPAWLRKNNSALKRSGILPLLKIHLAFLPEQNELKLKEKVINGKQQINRGLKVLIDGLQEGRKDAAEGLFETACLFTLLVERYYAIKPELFLEKAKAGLQIPVLAKPDPKWIGRAKEMLARLSVGEKWADFHFKEFAYDELSPSRAWARQAIKFIDANRLIGSLLVDVGKYFEAGMGKDIVPNLPGEWIKDVLESPPFSKTTAKLWARLARKIIRAEFPDFHKRSEWAREVAGIRQRYRDAPGKTVERTGTIQNKLLDKIGDAIESLAK